MVTLELNSRIEATEELTTLKSDESLGETYREIIGNHIVEDQCTWITRITTSTTIEFDDGTIRQAFTESLDNGNIKSTVVDLDIANPDAAAAYFYKNAYAGEIKVTEQGLIDDKEDAVVTIGGDIYETSFRGWQ